MKKKIVFIGLSGGVDSAVSAALLKKATPNNFEKLFGRPTPKGFRGYEVVGVFIKTWHPEFFPCNEEEERLDAMRVAAHLDISFLTFDFEDVYKKEVADYMIREYKMGRTPNPDVMCNKEVKFGAFLKKALAMGADFVATGHYAQNFSSPLIRGRLGGGLNSITPPHFFPTPPDLPLSGEANGFPPDKEEHKGVQGEEELHWLRQSPDPLKDQSYFLWTLNQKQLSKIIFPVGHLKKTEVRKLAKKFHLPVAEKKDSQGICFLGAVDLKEFLKHYIKEKKGEVYNVEGEKIGHHDGVVFHTIGERHGFTITKKSPTDGAYYVVGKDIKKNILIVSQKSSPTYPDLPFSGETNGFPPDKGEHKGVQGEREIRLKNTNWISKSLEQNKTYTAQIRYHGEFLPCKITCARPSLTHTVIFTKPVLVASGQSCVVYDKDICLGGGVVV